MASPNATYELVVKTEMKKGTTIPKGRFSLPREAKQQNRDRILVFADGKQAEEARQAGADIVGGPELVDGVRLIHNTLQESRPHICDSPRSSVVGIKLACSYVPRPSFVPLLLNLGVSSALEG